MIVVMPIIAVILKNGDHFEFSSDKRDFPNKWPKSYIHAKFGACITIWTIQVKNCTYLPD